MRQLTATAIGTLLLMRPLSAADVTTHYTVTLDVYVHDEHAMCKRAWHMAAVDHDAATADAMTQELGNFSGSRCVATIYQTTAGDVVESRSVEVRAVE